MNEGWKSAVLGDVIEGYFDGPHATPKPSASGPVFLGIKNISPGGRLELNEVRHIAWDDYPRWTKRVTPAHGDIVLSYEATLHRYAIIPEGFVGCLGRRMALIRLKPDMDVKFMLYYMLSPIWRAEVERHIINGATVDRIPIAELPNFRLNIPDRGRQEKIAGILSAYDELIENNLKRIKLLEEKAQQTYEEWFVRMRFPGHESTPINPATSLPEGWVKAPLMEKCVLIMGQSPKSEFYNDSGEGLPFHQGVTHYGSRFPKTKGWSTEGKRKADVGDILFSVRAPVGRINVADCELILGRGLAAIRPHEGLLSFTLYQLKSLFFEEDLMGGGAIFNSINKKELSQLKLLVPKAKILGQFESMASNIDRQIFILNQQVVRLTEARDILLPRLMTGMVDVEELDVELPMTA